jgi:cytochrome P450
MKILGRRGNYLQYFNDPIQGMRTLEKYGPVVAFVRDTTDWVFGFGPDCNREVLSRPYWFQTRLFSLPVPANSAVQRLCAGLLNMNGEPHLRQRQLMRPAFQPDYVENYRDQMVAITERRLNQWRAGQVLDMARETRELALEIAVKTLFGLDLSQPEAGLTVSMLKRWAQLGAANAIYELPYNIPGSPYWQLLKLSERLETRLQNLIEQKRVDPSSSDDALSMLIRAQRNGGLGLTDSQLIGQSNLLFIGGYEKIACALVWTLFLLALHPRIMIDLLDELEGCLRGNAPTMEQLPRLPFLDKVVKESLRLIPPVYGISRRSTADVQLGDYSLPPGTCVTLSPYITHHKPEIYDEPERFIPERWHDLDPSPYEYLPFGAGAHACLGMPMASLELKIILALLLQRYRLTLLTGARIDRQASLTLSPRPGMPMVIERQDWYFAVGKIQGNALDLVEVR